MTGAVVFWLLIVLGLAWTGLWAWVLLSSRRSTPEVEVKVSETRRLDWTRNLDFGQGA